MATKNKKPAENTDPVEGNFVEGKDKKNITVTPRGGNFVDKKEFESFAKKTEDTQNQILSILENMAKQPSDSKPKSKEIIDEAGPDSGGYLPAQYQKLFEKYFDPADGFTARLVFPGTDDNGRENGGINFTICVPLKFSNTDDGYRKMYKVDLRTRALLPHNIAKGIEEWCERVRQNLRYDKTIKTK